MLEIKPYIIFLTQTDMQEAVQQYLGGMKRSNVQPAIVARNEAVLLDFMYQVAQWQRREV